MHSLAIEIRQFGNGAVKALEIVVGLLSADAVVVGEGGEFSLFALLLAQDVVALIDDDAGDPAGEGGVVAERASSQPGFAEGGLDGVVHVGGVGENAPRQSAEERQAAADQHVKLLFGVVIGKKHHGLP